MPDYSKSKIYKIVCNETGETYYGSTVQTLAKRLAGHKKNKKRCSSKQIMERGNYDIVLCEECPCENIEQLHAIERKWIEKNECVNKYIPSRTFKEWYETNKVRIREQQKVYKQTNKTDIADYHRNYYQRNKQKIREQQQIYRENNKI